ncbi:Atrazine chlorohydrolase [Variovorax boronicumulans]|uniref:amidohydrolase family protein n=1 Tax=Variovorax boronicumulans TaxID=436515 RepID=UPI000BB3E477|nr:amidohydrolase family protein [Variovorax boronicumulans]PBI95804.1 Atrazine chlorohydrolase [Variovorax boronicumulans]
MTHTLIKNASILTRDPKLGELHGSDLLIDGDRIAAVGPNLQAPPDAEVIDAKGMVLMPGLIDGHRHVWEIIDMGRLVKTRPAEYAPYYQQWKMRTIVSMTPEDNYLAELIGGLQAIDSGVTTVLDYAHGQPTEDRAMAAAQGLRDSGIAGWFAFQLGVSSSYKPGDTVSLAKADGERIAMTNESHWKTAERLQKELFSDSTALLQLGLAPSGNNGSRIDDIRKEWTRARGMGVKMLAAHIHKPEQPHAPGVMGHRDSGMPDLHEAGLLGPDYQATHANRLTSEELKMLRDTGGMICATAMGEFPYVMSPSKGPSVHGRARAAGVPTGMGIDISLALTGDYFEHIRATFWSLYLDPECRGYVGRYTSEDILDFATSMGAQAVRLGGVTGTITVGKRADLVLLSTDRIGFGMAGSLADRVVTFAGTPDVDSVWIAGTARKRHGKMLGVDWANLKARLVEAQERVGALAASIKFV